MRSRHKRRGRKQKWFQVTRVAACSPTGMPGPNTAFRNGLALSPSLPETAFGRLGSMLRSRQARVSDEARASQRPFAPPERLPVSRPPLRDQCSRPAASTPCRIRSHSPFDRGFLPSSPVSRFRGEINTRDPLPTADPTYRPSPPALLLFGTFQSLRIVARPGSSAGSLPPRNARFRSLPGSGTF